MFLEALEFWVTVFKIKSENSIVYADDYRTTIVYEHLSNGQSREQLKLDMKIFPPIGKTDGLWIQAVSVLLRYFLNS